MAAHHTAHSAGMRLIRPVRQRLNGKSDQGGGVMSLMRQELEPKVAASRALDALLEAGRYTGHGLSTLGARAGRRAAVARAEGARRTGGAWSALRGTTPPPRRRRSGTIVVALAAGGGAALAIRHGFVAWRASDPDAELTQRLRGVLRPDRPATPVPSPSVQPEESTR